MAPRLPTTSTPPAANPGTAESLRLAIVADTHGQLRPEVLERLAGVDAILHAGDVGSPDVLARLRALAPVFAVRGNVDTGELAALPDTATGDLGGISYGLVHRREDVPNDWGRRLDLVIFGHSHRPELEWRGGALWLNPGSCGPRRFQLPLTFGFLTIRDRRVTPEIVAVAY